MGRKEIFEMLCANGFDYDTSTKVVDILIELHNKTSQKRGINEFDVNTMVLSTKLAEAEKTNKILGTALTNAWETIISQYIGEEHYMDFMEEWKEKNNVEFVGVDGQLLEDYFLIQAEDEFNKENKDE